MSVHSHIYQKLPSPAGMPTPVSIARQCLTAEAAHALDEAVGVARRRGHSQTTSLHAVSALLSLPSSMLREACARARGGEPAYSTRLHFKPLELCLSMSLDRVPSRQRTDDPPVSNSLMAAIKRSQAIQRRPPENFHLYHQLSSQSSINNIIKVELQQLIISILDDPVVSRVFSEAGFRSSEIKLAILRPLSNFLRYTASRRGPPLFLCSLNTDPGPGQGGIMFPFSVPPGFSQGGGEANCRRIGEVLLERSGGRSNPLLVGACAQGALREFIRTFGKSNRALSSSIFPEELSQLTVMDIESNICESSVNERLDEAVSMVASQLPGQVLVVSFGNLEAFIGGATADSESDPVSRVVARLASFLEDHRGKVRLIGSAASIDTYSKFVGAFPAAEKDWELQLLPITTLQTSMAEWCPRSRLMESSVPFAGFFSSSADYDCQVLQCSPYHYPSQHNLCSEKKSERETMPIPMLGSNASIADHYQCSLPAWLQITEPGSNVKEKANDNKVAISTTITGLQSEGGNKSQHALGNPQIPLSNIYWMDSQVKAVMGFQPAEQRSEMMDDWSVNRGRCKSVNLSLSTDTQKISRSQGSFSLLQAAPSPYHSRKVSFLTKLQKNSPKPEEIDSSLLRSVSNLSNGHGCTASPASATSTTTNLGPTVHSEHEVQKLDEVPVQLNVPAADISEGFFKDDFKALYKSLTERVGRQHGALSLISQTITQLKIRNFNTHQHQMSTRGDVWFTFLGPDRMGKWEVAVALSEVLHGNREHLIHIDLSSQSDDPNPRGKTPVDIIAGELSRKPVCVMFLENVDRADEQVQSSLLQAILTGKFSDSHGRDTEVHHAIFVATLTSMKSNQILQSHQLDGTTSRFSEERVLGAKGWPMKILVEQANKVFSASNPMHMNKRKLMDLDEDETSCENLEVINKCLYRISSRNLDLNLPEENAESHDCDDDTIDCDMISDSSNAWLQDLIDRTDASVIFKPYDFDSLAEKISKEIRESFCQTIGLKCMIEIESEVMEQLLSAVYQSNGDNKAFEDWMAHVLSQEFTQIRRQYELTDQSTVRLIACQDAPMEEQVQGNCLPSIISVN